MSESKRKYPDYTRVGFCRECEAEIWFDPPGGPFTYIITECPKKLKKCDNNDIFNRFGKVQEKVRNKHRKSLDKLGNDEDKK